MKISRSELYERVWQEPMKTLAAAFDMSDVALRKICIKAEVPVPQRGYWAKLQAGKKVDLISLSIRPPGMSETVYIKESRYGGTSLTEEELLGPIPDPPIFHELIEQVEERVVKIAGKAGFLKNLERPHPAIAKLLKSDDERRAKQAASRYQSSWDDPLFDGLFEKRRLRILNSIFFG